MKSFLEEYGFAILAAIAIIVLIALATPVGRTIKEALSSTVSTESAHVENTINEKIKIDNMDVNLKQVGNKKIEIIVFTDSTTNQYDAA